MGQAMLSGWLDADNGLTAEDFCVIEHSPEKCACLRREYGVAAFASVKEAFCAAGPFQMVFLAVKPQGMSQALEDVAQEMPQATASEAALVVSIAAGVTTEAIGAALPAGTRIVRVMPNTPLQVGEGATVVAAGRYAVPADVAHVCAMFAQLGMAEVVDEADIDAVCALSGGGPAYTALMIEALAKAGAAQGLDPALAEKLAFQTMYGTCKLMEETGSTPEQTRVAVCSPGGTTLAALAAMEGEGGRSAGSAGFTESVNAGIAAAVARAKELASC